MVGRLRHSIWLVMTVTDLGYIEQSDKVMMLTTWDDVLRVLQEAHGDKASVAVYPNSDIQCFG